jgi:hypothetical protein
MNEGRNLNTMNASFRQYAKPTKYQIKVLPWPHIPFLPCSVKALSLEKQQVFGGEHPMSGSQGENKTSSQRKEKQ